MKLKIFIFVVTFILIFSLPLKSFAEQISDYLILQDIPPYKIDVPKQLFKSFDNPVGGPKAFNSSGIIGATGHFPDHIDKTYEVMYIGGNGIPSPTVQVTQHPGSDSDRWLLHEVESSFRGREKEGWLGQGLRGSTSIREINGNLIFDYGNIDYRWLSNNIVVYIHYTDLAGTKPEPLEVVQAYLTKFPSTITLTDTEAKSTAHNEQWIKDEMDRRLWLCDKWIMQLQLGKAEMNKVLKESVDHMNVFLDYREKYYSVSAASEKQTLWGYLQANNGTAIKNKLAEYKDWWAGE